MGLIKKINCDYILSQLSEAQIFYAYFGKFEFNKVYPSCFRNDENPSTGFYISKTGKLIYNDLATSEKLDCFAFVAKKFKISYGEAIRKVACDFGLVECEGVTPFSREELGKIELGSQKTNIEKNIKIIPDKWTEAYLNFWKQFYITEKELEENKVFPVKKLYINDVLIPNYGGNVRYALTVSHKDKVYKKIYFPYAEHKKFKWVSDIPIYIPFGIFDLPNLSKTLVITKAQKDRIILKKYFTDVIALQNESPSALRDSVIKHLKSKYDTIYINCDLDKAGKNALTYFLEKDLIPLMLPDIVYEKYGIKDIADFVKHFGIKRLEDFLKYKELLNL